MEVRIPQSTFNAPVAPRSGVPSTVRSPFVGADGYAGSISDAPSPPPPLSSEAAAPTKAMSLGRKALLASLAVLSIGGGVIGGIAVHTAHGPAAVAATRPASTPQQDRAEAHALVDKMIDAGRNGREVPDNLKAKVHEHLDRLPIDVVRAVERNGAKIAIMREGETPADLGVIKVADPAQWDAKALSGIADRAFAQADLRHGPRIVDLEQQLEAAKARARAQQAKYPERNQPQGLSGVIAMSQSYGDRSFLDPEVQRLTGALNKERTARAVEAWDTISEQSGGRVEPYGASMGSFNPMIAMTVQSMPVSVNMLAQMHGARTPQEIKQFSDLMVAMNGPRLETAQREFVEMMKAGNPGFSLPANLSVDDRAFVAGNSDVVIPSYYLERTEKPNPDPLDQTPIFDASETPSVVSGHDHGSLRDWKSGLTAGQYWFQDDRKTIVYHEKYLLDDPTESGETVDHEFGHAYEDALKARDPKFYGGFLPRWENAYRVDSDAPLEQHRFPTSYAGTNRKEFFAEEFALHFSPRAAETEKRDPDAAGLIKEAIADAPNAATWNVSR